MSENKSVDHRKEHGLRGAAAPLSALFAAVMLAFLMPAPLGAAVTAQTLIQDAPLAF